MSEGEPMADVLGPIGELAAHAIRYAEANLEIFPVNPRDKTPLISQYEATTDLAQLDRWWHEWPTALIGHRLQPHHIILDIDPRHGGGNVWQALKEEVGELPVTRAHASGRGDGGGHLWWLRPDDKLSTRRLNEWAQHRQIGHDAGGGRWTAGIDILQHNHRYTILPPSPHPNSGRPYTWIKGRGTDIPPAPLPVLIAELLSEVVSVEPPRPPREPQPDSIADWYSNITAWTTLLTSYGWSLIAGDGNSDGSRWRHPTATSAFSATIRHGLLFVYSTSTPFVPTESGVPHGYTPFKAYATLEHQGDQSAAAKALRRQKDGDHPAAVDITELLIADPTEDDVLVGPQPIDWQAFWNREHIGEDWLVEPVVPRGRQVALWAKHKTGKSLLALEIAAAAATGTACLDQPASQPIHVMYVDLEMTEDDLHDRLLEMGYGPDTNLDHLHYYLLPALPPLDSADGGVTVVKLAIQHRAELVVIDTMARAVSGDENDADTYRAFYRYTGMHLKAAGIAMMRLDHGGKDPAKGQRGSSSKGDDVDIVWQLSLNDDGLTLKRDAARMSWVPERVALRRSEDPLRHELVEGLWPAGTKDVAEVMERLGIDPELSQSAAIRAFRESGHAGKTDVLRAAWKYRRRDPLTLLLKDAEA